MTKKEWPHDQQFNDWWNAGVDGEDNPYVEDTRAYWAWEGWLAGRAAEPEAIATEFMERHEAVKQLNNYWHHAAKYVRERGQHD